MKENITYPMNANQWETFKEWDQDRAMTEYNTTVCLPFERSSAGRFLRAMQQILDEQRYLHIHLVRQDGDIMVCEDWQMPNKVHHLHMSDSEWEEAQASFTKPFDPFGEACIRLHLVETDSKMYAVVETFHLLFDGLSHKAIWNSLEDALKGIPIYQQGDIAAEMNLREIADYDSEAYRRAQAYYKASFSGIHFTDICHNSDSPWGRLIFSHPYFPATVIDSGCQRLGVSPTVVFYAAYALTLGQMAGKQKVMFYAINHGRERRLSKYVYGNYLNSLPILIDINGQQSIRELLQQTKFQLFVKMRNKPYPLDHLLRDIGLEDIGTEVSFEGNYIYEYLKVDGENHPTYHIDPNLCFQHLATCILLRDDQYELVVDGSEALYTHEQLNAFAQKMGEYAIKLTTINETTPINGLW